MLNDYIHAYEVLCRISSSKKKTELSALRKKNLEALSNQNQKIVRLAFDTRRIDQATTYIPRRNLQTYHRSEAFINKDASEKIKTFFKLKTAVDSLKEDFNGDPDWLDSYARILSNALDRTLRVEQRDLDFFKPQLDYLEELLYLRYRLRPDDIVRLNEKELRTLVLDRDERLLHKTIYANYNLGGMNKTNVPQPNFTSTSGMVKGPDNLIDKLFGDVKASKENKEVERTVTITIKDKIADDKSDLTKEG